MNWLEILPQIFEVCIIPLLGVLTGVIIKWIQVKQAEIAANSKNELIIKYTNLLSETISSCVICTNQTYVNALKEQGKFDRDAQKIAFAKTFEAVMNILSTESKQYLTEIYGDLTSYVTNKIEAEVYYNKG